MYYFVGVKFNLSLQVPAFLTGEPVLRCLGICWLVTKLICYPLWMADRFFPLVPVHELLLQTPAFIHAIIFGLSLICMALLVFFPRKHIAIVLLLLEIIACLLDQNRWQAWEWFFVFLLAAYVFIREEKSRIFSWQLIIIGLYFFSGLSKCNSSFINNVWKELFLNQFAGVVHTDTWVLRMGYLLPLLEIGSAIALTYKLTVKPAVWVLIVLQVISLLVFSKINTVIVPWNMLMPVVVFILFYQNGLLVMGRKLWKPVSVKILVLSWWILSCLQLAGITNQYDLGYMFNRRTAYMYICTDDLHARLKLGDNFMYTRNLLPCADALSVYQWSMREMNSPPYPEKWVYKIIAGEWNKLYPGGKSRFFLVSGGVRREVREIWP